MILRIISLCLIPLLLCIIAIIVKPTLLEPFLVTEQNLSKADALVVMAGSRYERIPAAARLYHLGAAPRILLTNDGIFSSWSAEDNRNLYEVEWAKKQLLQLGVPSNAIEILQFTKCGSYYDAINTRKYVSMHDSLRSLLVVTSFYHSSRTLMIFQKIFHNTNIEIGIYPIPKDPLHK